MLDPIRLPLATCLIARALRAYAAISGGPSIPAIYSDESKALGPAVVARRIANRNVAIDTYERAVARMERAAC